MRRVESLKVREAAHCTALQFTAPDAVKNVERDRRRKAIWNGVGNYYAEAPIPERCGYEAWQLGLLVHEHSQYPGAHRTPAAEAGNDVLSHAKGKYGELAFHEWLVRQSVTPTHTPFRNDYTRKVLDDDFVVNGLRLEIKTKMRKVSSPFPPPVHFNVNLGKKEIEDAIHVFIELSSKVKIVDNPAAIIVGWAPPALIADKGVGTWPGKESDNKAFTFKRYDWDLNIRDLLPPAGLIKAIGGARR
ncbi:MULTISPECIES: hypothetical protein [Sinorhizobium]|uniref:hypothetical protein n=1 Tax=Sinorhizobium TaxID=28105 RepID=UPI0004852905|nr:MULTISPECIES: hypothetical protein [Sinorhizobium]WOS67193.1 hypothetical protein SFGR64A_30940 [Sinorhizobium fredii GR64]